MSKEPKIVIKKIDKYEIYVEGDSTIYSAKTEKEAKKIAKDIKKEIERESNEEIEYIESLKKIDHNLSNYIRYLKKRLWYLSRDKNVAEEEKRKFKENMNILNGILKGTIRVTWASFNNDSEYIIEKVEEDE